MKYDVINKPKHYNQYSIEPIDVIESWELNYNEGNVVKYMNRYKHKNGLEDLKKCRFYINRIIDNYENNSVKQDLHTGATAEAIECDQESVDNTESSLCGYGEEVRKEGLPYESCEAELHLLFREGGSIRDWERLFKKIFGVY